MKCSVCLSEFESQSLCPVCGAQNEIDLDKENIDWRLLYTVASLIEGEMIKANIESAEIPVFLFSKQDSAYRLSVNDFSNVEIYVPKEYLNEAKIILNDILNNESV